MTMVWLGRKRNQLALITARIVTKFGVPGVLMKAIKSCKFHLDQDAALGVQGAPSNFHSKNDFFQISFSVQVSVDQKEHFRPLKQKTFFLCTILFLHDILY
jgi:hypothetical protein